jgi:hypothetical protein
MAKLKLQNDSTADSSLETVVLETRKVKALEKIANSLDALTIWFEEVNKNEWSDRIAYYLYEFYNMAKNNSQSDDSIEQTSQPDAIAGDGELAPPPRKVRPKKDIEKV